MWWLVCLPALAGAIGAGEELVWGITYAGITGAVASATVSDAPGGSLYISTAIKNADWYARIYTIDDTTRSTWVPGDGSTRYETRFREGGFQQDQDMRLAPSSFSVWRHQKLKEGWKEWTTEYPGHPYAEDPVTAFFAIRTLDGAGPWSMPVFSGEATWPLHVEDAGRETLAVEPLGEVPVRVLSLQTRHRGEWEQQGRFLVYVTDDERRIPVRFVIRSSIGAIRADLIGYTPPSSAEPAASPP